MFPIVSAVNIHDIPYAYETYRVEDHCEINMEMLYYRGKPFTSCKLLNIQRNSAHLH